MLGRLTGSARDSLLMLGSRQSRMPGESLLREGERDDKVILLLSGYVKVEVNIPEGKPVLLAIRTQGDLIGEMGPLESQPRSATVRASTPTWYRSIPWADLEKYLGRHPQGAIEFGRMLSARLRWANERRVDCAASRRASVKVARVIVDLLDAYGLSTPKGIQLGVRLTQQDLAYLASVSLSAAEVELRDLKDNGVMKTRYRGFVILDDAELRRRAKNLHDNPL